MAHGALESAQDVQGNQGLERSMHPGDGKQDLRGTKGRKEPGQQVLGHFREGQGGRITQIKSMRNKYVEAQR
jgi:hypothetical protein